MLVLTRKLQQQIKIGDQIIVTILRVKGNTVRVGITAPREVRVVRGELPQETDVEETSVPTIAVEEMASAASEELREVGEEITTEAAEENVIAFRVRCVSDEMPAETSTQVSAAHLPLRRIHDRFGGAPLKHLMASCATLEK
jgi:carbon storage regulator CsrA